MAYLRVPVKFSGSTIKYFESKESVILRYISYMYYHLSITFSYLLLIPWCITFSTDSFCTAAAVFVVISLCFFSTSSLIASSIYVNIMVNIWPDLTAKRKQIGILVGLFFGLQLLSQFRLLSAINGH